MRAEIFHKICTIATIAGVLATSMPVLAQEATSSSFMTNNQVIDGSGGDATSTSFSTVFTGEDVIAGEATSTNFQISFGPLYYETFTAVSQNWQWFDDETNETPSSSLAAENSAPTGINDANVIKLRVTVRETESIGAEGMKFKLQFSTASDFSSGVGFVQEIGSCTLSSSWCYGDGVDQDGDIITTALLSDPDSCVASVGDGCGTHNESGTTTSTYEHPADAAVEYEFTIKASGASPATTYFFRPVGVNSGVAVLPDTGEAYPSLLMGGGTLSFTISGIASSTATEGVTTDIDTTATEIPFGLLPFATSITAAQRLTVSTNAGQGYQIFTVARQGLLNEYGDELFGVDATNASPSGWTTGCTGSAAGCFGYHAGDDVLAGGSTRFASDDTFARFSTTSASEIAYSATSVSNRDTDIVYRALARNTQEAGNYSSNLVYIVVPTF